VVAAKHSDGLAVGDESIEARYRHKTPFYCITLLTSPARIEQLAFDPTGRARYLGVINNFGPKGSGLFASYGSFINWKEDHCYDAGRPSRVVRTANEISMLGIPVGPYGLTADWRFVFGERTFDVAVDWHATSTQKHLWEAGWKLDGIARHIGDGRAVDLAAGPRGPYRSDESACVLLWEDDPRYAHTLAVALVPGSCQRGDNVYVAPNVDRPVSWAAWQTVWVPGGTTLREGEVIRGGRWRVGASADAADAGYAAALLGDTSGSPSAVAAADEGAVRSDRDEAVVWVRSCELPSSWRGEPQVSRKPDGSWILTDGRVLASLVPATGDEYKARWYVASDGLWQLACVGGPMRRYVAVAEGESSSLEISAEGLGADGKLQTTTKERWTIRSDPSRVHIESRETLVSGGQAHPLYTVLAYPGGSNKWEIGEYDVLAGPHLRPQADLVIGQHALRSPALAVQHDSAWVALVPDLLVHRQHDNYGDELCERHFGLCMDLDIANRLVDAPLLGFGWREMMWVYSVWRVEEGYFCRDLGGCAPRRSVRLAFDLLVEAAAAEYSVVSATQRFLWEQIGRRYFCQSRLPQTQPAAGAFDEAWKWGRELYDSREVDGVRLGAVRVDREAPPDAMFMSWFNSLRTSYGIYSEARCRGDDEMKAKARSTLELVLSAPQEKGAFPTIAAFREDGFEWIGSHRNFANQMWWGPNSLSTFDMGWAAYWVLRWYQDLEPDERALRFARSYGDFLVETQLPRGAVPSWFVRGTLEVCPHLRESAQTASSVMFLAELARVTAEPNYLSAAERGGRFVTRECLYAGRWDDYEVYYSNAPKSEGAADPISGQKAQDTLSMHFAALGFLTLFQLTRDHVWLENGQRVVDHMLQYQAVWPASFLSLYSYGGFSVQNTDQEWNDARQSQIGVTLLDYARETGRADYAERGIVAIRAGYATMASQTAEIANPRYFDLFATGVGVENYAHNPYDAPTTPVPTPHFDWGVGSAGAGFAEARNRFGGIWVDARHKKAYGIDNVYVESACFDDGLELDITSPSPGHVALLKVTDLEAPRTRLSVNQQIVGSFTREQLSRGVEVRPRHVVRIVHNPARSIARVGEPFEVAASVSPAADVENLTLRYRTGAADWEEVRMRPTGDSRWVGTVPPTALVHGQRLEYYMVTGQRSTAGTAPEVDASLVPFRQLPT
jgi:hypothetical protein